MYSYTTTDMGIFDGIHDRFLDSHNVLKPWEFVLFPMLEPPVTFVAHKVAEPVVTWGVDKVVKIDHVVDATLDGTTKVIGAVGSLAGTVDDILSGRSHALLYAGIAVVTIIALPIVLKKIL